jgi:carboxymethylenebutenolidase
MTRTRALSAQTAFDGGANMCDQDYFEKDRQEYERLGRVTRKQFGVMLGAGMAMMLPRVANAAAVTESDVNVTTPDGIADCYFVHPASGTAPGVLVWPDIFGLRPAFRQMAKRLAESGYSVLVVNPFYRSKKAPTAADGSATPIDQVRPLAQALNETTHMTDAKAFIGWLDKQPSVAKNRKMGTQGYCMGGPIAFRTAAAVPDRVGAVASFHGGGLVTDKPDSPHLQAAKSKAQFLIAIAENDDKRSPKDKDVLKETFAKADLPAEIEVYAGSAHGWCPPDSRVYNEPQAEKAWSRLLVLYGKALA